MLVGAEPELPYERPHLSKGYLLGTVTRERLPLRPGGQYTQLDVTLRLGERVVELDSARRTARLESGETVGWDVVCIATGRRLPGFEAVCTCASCRTQNACDRCSMRGRA